MRGKSLSIEIGKDELISLDHRYKDILMNTRNEEVFFFLSIKENKKRRLVYNNESFEEISSFLYKNHAKKLKIFVIKIHSGNRENRAISIRSRAIQIRSFSSF